jgi:hypothetical protein
VKTPKTTIVSFDNIKNGCNFTDDMNQLKPNQVQDCLDAVLSKKGPKRRPGTLGGDISLSTNGRGLHVYTQLDGTETKLLVSNGFLYSTPTDIGSKTQLFNLTGTGKAYFSDYLDKCWITNGTSMVKVENNVAYQIGIDPPSGVAAAAAAGGTLTDGTYTVYACYARSVGGSNVLYSVGENLGTVTLGSGNNTIAISSFANSTDPQVGNKVIFLTEPTALGGATYFYHETGDNTTTSFNITSTANKDTTEVYGTVAEENTIPGTFDYIFAFNKSIYGSIDNVLYKSIKDTANVYNLERFVSSSVIPFQILGIFSVGIHLYLNTRGGIIVLPYGDINAEWDHLTTDYFYDINTVEELPQRGVIGLTYQSIRIFNGEKFLSHDIGEDIKPKLDKVYDGTAYDPFGLVVRGIDRLEYHFSYCNEDQSTASNNERLVLNVDRIQTLPNNEVLAPWELWSCGANYMAISRDQTIYNLQDHATTPIMYKFDKNNTIDEGIYLRDGTLGTSESLIDLSVVYGATMKSLYTYIHWGIGRVMAQLAFSMQIKVYIREGTNPSASQDLEYSTQAKWGTAVWGTDTWGSESFTHRPIKIPEDIQGYIMYVEIKQTANDPNFHVLSLELEGQKTEDRDTMGGQ